jgi:hypothetical protein
MEQMREAQFDRFAEAQSMWSAHHDRTEQRLSEARVERRHEIRVLTHSEVHVGRLIQCLFRNADTDAGLPTEQFAAVRIESTVSRTYLVLRRAD